jgi:dihydrofolate reductase
MIQMRKLKLQMQLTLDGFIAVKNGEMDWVCFNWTDDIKAYVTELTSTIDTILLGRNLAEGFIPYWTNSFNSPNPEEGAEIFVKTPKIVFTKTLETSAWENTVLAKGELNQEVNKLKKEAGKKDIIVYGGGKFVASLIKEQLIDELHLFVNPVAIGSGISIFNQITTKQNYQLIHSKSFACGIVVINYHLQK